MKAKQLKTVYFNKGYLFGPNSPATKEAQRQVQFAFSFLGLSNNVLIKNSNNFSITINNTYMYNCRAGSKANNCTT